jgi:predicted nuclease of restriction endonuclease-like (RecB) superfamily
MKVLSSRNLKYMRVVSEGYQDEPIVQQLAAQIPWFHNCVLLDKVKDPEQRTWYIRKTVEHGQSRNVLVHHISSWYRLTIEGEDYRIDLLFYHLQLRCFVVIELKTTAFKSEYAGKMNFYLSALADLVKNPDDQPSTGIILCISKGDTRVRYTLQRIASLISVSTSQLPKELEESLPTVEALEQEIKTIKGKRKRSEAVVQIRRAHRPRCQHH